MQDHKLRRASASGDSPRDLLSEVSPGPLLTGTSAILDWVTFWGSRTQATPSILRGDTVGSATLLAFRAHRPMRVVVFSLIAVAKTDHSQVREVIKKRRCASLTVLDVSDAADPLVLSGLRPLNIKIPGLNPGGYI